MKNKEPSLRMQLAKEYQRQYKCPFDVAYKSAGKYIEMIDNDWLVEQELDQIRRTNNIIEQDSLLRR